MSKKKFAVKDVFNIGDIPKSVKITGMKDDSNEFIPHTDSEYQFRMDYLRDFIAWWEFSSNEEALFLTGPTGSGKSSLVLQIAARLNWPVQRITAHARMEYSDLIGRPVIQADGSMGFQYGPLAYAMKYGHLFLLDEIDILDPGITAGLNGIIQGEPLTIAENGGEVIMPHEDFRFVATGNSAGGGDDGIYLGVNRQNMALMDRFWIIHVDYPEAEVEKEVIRGKLPQNISSNYDDATLTSFISVASEIRKLFVEEELEITMSTRVLIRWVKMTAFFYAVSAQDKSPLHYALDRAILNRAEPETKDAVHEIAQRIFGE